MSDHSIKRSPDPSDQEAASSKRVRTSLPFCLFGGRCYRRNPHHFREYSHGHLLNLCVKYPAKGQQPPAKELQNFEVSSDIVLEQLDVFRDVCRHLIAEQKQKIVDEGVENKPENDKSSDSLSAIQKKLEMAKPCSIFLTKIEASPETHRAADSIYFTELLHPSLGKLKRSLQINFMVEWDFLRMNYEVTNTATLPLLLIYGEENPDLAPGCLPSHVRAIRVRPRFPFGTHHTKMMMFQYEDDSVRVIVSTANLVGSDWQNRTQALWVSPRCPVLSSPGSDGESPTGFKSSLISYLSFYELTPMKSYIDVVRKCDFSQVNVFLVGSVPNAHRGQDMAKWGLRRVAAILRKHLTLSSLNNSWPVVAQCSSIGSLGPNESSWLKGELGKCLSTTHSSSGYVAPIKVIYPSKGDVLQSHDGILGGGCLPYSRKTHEKQPWFQDFLHRWVAEGSGRTKAMPHVKTYTRLSPDFSRAAYFLLTSANMSKAAWGNVNKAGDSQQIQSYELGVLFLPEFVNKKEFFDVGIDLKLPFDVPLIKYKGGDDSPWFMDYLKEALSH